MSNERIPTITREDLLRRIEALPEGCEISFSGLEFIDFETTNRQPYRVRFLFQPNVFRKADGDVVVENPE
ncbi:hypothetical protein Pssp01_29510 [Pseudomonas sp. NBRC 100443]|nr:hypothetical protein Pssp01_29510 [Pseudomonas sp. NBRC 100443]